MTDLAPDDYRPRGELGEQFKKDVLALLTDTQKEKYAKAYVLWTYGGDAPPEGKASVRWKK